METKMTYRVASRRHALLLALAAASVTSFAHAEDAYPNKPITLVVPYPAGGANDAVARLVGQKIGEQLKQTVIIDNRPGAGTTIAMAAVAKSPADGYTLVLGSLASQAVSPHLYTKPGYEPIADFAPIGLIGVAPTVLIVAKDSSFNNVKSIVEAAKKKPGTLTYGSSGNGSPLHLAGELFKQTANIQVNHIPYKGGSAHTMDLIGGRLDMIFDTTTSAMPMIKGDKVRPLAVAAPARLPELPGVPTFAEAGYPQFEVNAWYALYAPAHTPKDIVARLSSELTKVLKQPEVVEKLSGLAVRTSPSTSQELASFTQAELDKYGKLIRAGNIRID
jgi:tripartite-type tricarboxylate transporter receptor subunit TctC